MTGALTSSAPLGQQKQKSPRSCLVRLHGAESPPQVAEEVPLKKTPLSLFREDPSAAIARKEALEGAQGLPKSDFLSCFQLEVEVLGGLKDEHNGGTQVELAQVLALAHGDALLVGTCHEAEVVVGALAVSWAVCVQVLGEARGRACRHL